MPASSTRTQGSITRFGSCQLSNPAAFSEALAEVMLRAI